MSAFWTLIQPSSSHFLRFQLFLGLHTLNLILLLAYLLLGLCLKLLLLPLILLFDLSGRVQGFLGHGFLFHLPGRRFLLQLLPLRCYLQGMLHLCIVSIVLVGMYVFYVLVLGFPLPLRACLGRLLLLFWFSL